MESHIKGRLSHLIQTKVFLPLGEGAILDPNVIHLSYTTTSLLINQDSLMIANIKLVIFLH